MVFIIIIIISSFSDSWQVLCFSRGLIRWHGTAMRFAVSPSLKKTEELPGDRAVHQDRRGRSALGHQPRSESIARALKIPSSRRLLCMFLLRKPGIPRRGWHAQPSTEQLGEHQPGNTIVGRLTIGTCGRHWRTFCCVHHPPAGQVWWWPEMVCLDYPPLMSQNYWECWYWCQDDIPSSDHMLMLLCSLSAGPREPRVCQQFLHWCSWLSHVSQTWVWSSTSWTPFIVSTTAALLQKELTDRQIQVWGDHPLSRTQSSLV